MKKDSDSTIYSKFFSKGLKCNLSAIEADAFAKRKVRELNKK